MSFSPLLLSTNSLSLYKNNNMSTIVLSSVLGMSFKMCKNSLQHPDCRQAQDCHLFQIRQQVVVVRLLMYQGELAWHLRYDGLFACFLELSASLLEVAAMWTWDD